jgi:predicted ATPase
MIGKTISHYRIIEKIGEGGMGLVYKAEDVKLNRTVALKIPPLSVMQDKDKKARFLREAQTCAALDHPNITRIYGVDEFQGQDFICMELVPGKTLAQILKDGTLSISDVVDIALQVCSALSQAHQKNIIHRDIKPENIKRTESGVVKVMDFGIAKFLDTVTLTKEGEILGTVAYMSPQQAVGDEIDSRSDIFSLGTVIYELLTGKLPFIGEQPIAVVYSLLNEEPLRIRELKENIPIELEQIVFKALRKDPRDRYQNISEMQKDIDSFKDFLEGKKETLELVATEKVFKEPREELRSDLVGREDDLEFLKEYLQKMLLQEGNTVFVAGEAGIGKTRIVQELANYAREKKVRYLIGRCIMGEGSLPYQPFVEIIGKYLQLKEIKREKDLETFITERLPLLSGRMTILKVFLNVSQADESILIRKEQLWDAITKLIENISEERPVLIHLDDVHWADESSLQLLYYLARHSRDSKIMIVCTYRPEDVIEVEPEHPLVSIQREMGREGLYQEIRLQRLREDDIKQMVISVFPGFDFNHNLMRMLHKETEGNPFFVLEILKLLKGEGIVEKENGKWALKKDIEEISIPNRVYDVVVRRVSKLDQAEKEILEVAAVDGEMFESGSISNCLNYDRIFILKTLQHLEKNHHLIQARERKYKFDHTKIREILYENIIPELRVEYHMLLGEFYRKNYQAKEDYAPIIAHHLYEGEEKEEALPYLIRAGDASARLFANQNALDYFQKAQEILEMQTVIEEDQLLNLYDKKANIFARLSRYKEGKDLAINSLDLARKLRDRKLEGRFHRWLGDFHIRLAEHQESLMHFAEAIKIAKETENKKLESMALADSGNVYYEKGDYDKALENYHQALDLNSEVKDLRNEATWLGNIAIIYDSRGSYDTALEYYQKALEMSRKVGDKSGVARHLLNMAVISIHKGEFDTALNQFEQVLKIVQEIGDRRVEGIVLGNIGSVYCDKKEYELSLRYYKRALEMAKKLGDRRFEGVWLGYTGISQFHLKEYDKAGKSLEESLNIARETGHKGREALDLIYYGITRVCQGNEEKGIELINQGIKIAQEIDEKEYVICGFLQLGKTYKICGYSEKGKIILKQAEKLAQETGNVNLCQKVREELKRASNSPLTD